MYSKKPLHSNVRGCATAMLFLWLCVTAGCKPLGASASATSGKAGGETVSVSTDSVNYMHDRGLQYTLYDVSKTPPPAVGGAIVYMLATGGEKGCCIALPKVWHPGIKLRLDWHEADREKTFPGEYSRELEIPRYDQPSDIYVVFYPKQEVELVVSTGEPGSPEWQGRLKQTPWEACLAENPRKVCKAALPKQFDAESSQGLCTYMKAENFPDADENCAFAIYECKRDYEDDEFCKNLLWGKRRQ